MLEAQLSSENLKAVLWSTPGIECRTNVSCYAFECKRHTICRQQVLCLVRLERLLGKWDVMKEGYFRAIESTTNQIIHEQQKTEENMECCLPICKQSLCFTSSAWNQFGIELLFFQCFILQRDMEPRVLFFFLPWIICVEWSSLQPIYLHVA